jgi:hypothetical protein
MEATVLGRGVLGRKRYFRPLHRLHRRIAGLFWQAKIYYRESPGSVYALPTWCPVWTLFPRRAFVRKLRHVVDPIQRPGPL